MVYYRGMDTSRVKTLFKGQNNGQCVVYVMSRDQRINDNYALLAAQADALSRRIPLIVLFVLYSASGFRAREQYEYMVCGLDEVDTGLHQYNIPFVRRIGNPKRVIMEMLLSVNAAAVYFDFSPLSGPRNLCDYIARTFDGSSFVVDTHNIVPVWVASDKQEFAAHTFRRKIHAHLERYLVDPPTLQRHPHSLSRVPESAAKVAIAEIVQTLPQTGIAVHGGPGERAALAHAKAFITDRLDSYGLKRNNPVQDMQSGLSPYLHFGQISSLRVACLVLDSTNEPPLLLTEARMAQTGDAPLRSDGMNALFEEMIVRKELSDNFCWYAESYKTLDSVPAWARKTLMNHAADHRDFTYSRDEWERALTHDDAWNAAQKQMAQTGKMHGYMRMYWAKKLLEWSVSPQDAIDTAIYLNDRYSIDGGDPNGYVGILWSIAGLHDRPWRERSVFGQIRYMNSAGLRRKFALDEYIVRWR